MSITNPYKRTCRIFTDGSYGNSGKWQYIIHPDYAQSPGHFIRAFLMIQKDLLTLFDYIEPSDANLNTHSFRIHELMLRVCVEIEANCTAILGENKYGGTDGKDWTMNDYKKIEQSHFLSQYEVFIPNWLGTRNIRQPFSSWSSQSKLIWYQAYNSTKHDRHKEFSEANFDCLIEAVCGLSALIAAQFWTHDFSPSGMSLGISVGGPSDGIEASIGDFFKLKFPTDIPDIEKYDFTHDDIDFGNDIFQRFVYT